MSEIVLQEGQMLVEAWHVEFKGMNRVRRSPENWIECRLVKMYHSTIYGGSTGHGKTVDEARLEMVLATARAICDDMSAFDHDADEIFKAEQHRWWLGKVQEWQDVVDEEDDSDVSKRERKQAKRRVKLLEQMMGEWQEEHDYWPEEASADSEARITARAAQIRADTAKRRAASARLSAIAAESVAVRADAS